MVKQPIFTSNHSTSAPSASWWLLAGPSGRWGFLWPLICCLERAARGHKLRQVELIHLLDSVPVVAWEAHCECSRGSALSGDSTWTRPSLLMDRPAVLAAGGQPVDRDRGQQPRDTVGVIRAKNETLHHETLIIQNRDA